MAFSIPGVKGIEFGLGFDFIGKLGSEVNDEYQFIHGKVMTTTNYNGGILGGLSNGMPIEFRLVLNPLPVFLNNKKCRSRKQKNTTLLIQGRHDPCIALRAQIVVESIAALAILDQIWMGEYYG